MTGLLTRSYDVDYSKADKNWHTWEYSDNHWLSHPKYKLSWHYIRQNEFPYDWRKQHRLILRHPRNIFKKILAWFWLQLISDSLEKTIDILNNDWYTVVFNSDKRKSAKHLRHWHALK